MRKSVLIISLVLVTMLFLSVYSLALQVVEDDPGSGGETVTVACKNPLTNNECSYGSQDCALFIDGSLSDSNDDGDNYYKYCGTDCDDSATSTYPGKTITPTCASKDTDCNGLIDENEDVCIPSYTVTTSYELDGTSFTLIAKPSYMSKCCYSTTTSYSNYEIAKSSGCQEMTLDKTKGELRSNSLSGALGTNYNYKIYCRKCLGDEC